MCKSRVSWNSTMRTILAGMRCDPLSYMGGVFVQTRTRFHTAEHDAGAEGGFVMALSHRIKGCRPDEVCCVLRHRSPVGMRMQRFLRTTVVSYQQLHYSHAARSHVFQCNMLQCREMGRRNGKSSQTHEGLAKKTWHRDTRKSI